MATEHYDVIIIGTGAGGGTLAHRLAPSGKRVLLLERGGYLPREPENWDSREVFISDRYLSGEFWYDQDGRAFKPHQQYFVGGNTKFYGAVLFRLRERDFGDVQHHGGLSPAWPISYQDLEPYYAAAEQLTWCTGRPARTRPSRPGPGRFLTRRYPTSRASSSCRTISRRPVTGPSTSPSASTWTSPTRRRGAVCAATASTAFPA